MQAGGVGEIPQNILTSYGRNMKCINHLHFTYPHTLCISVEKRKLHGNIIIQGEISCKKQAESKEI